MTLAAVALWIALGCGVQETSRSADEGSQEETLLDGMKRYGRLGRAMLVYAFDHDGYIPPYATHTSGSPNEPGVYLEGDIGAWKKCLILGGAKEEDFGVGLAEGLPELRALSGEPSDQTTVRTASLQDAIPKGLEREAQGIQGTIRLNLASIEDPREWYAMSCFYANPSAPLGVTTVHGNWAILIGFNGAPSAILLDRPAFHQGDWIKETRKVMR